MNDDVRGVATAFCGKKAFADKVKFGGHSEPAVAAFQKCPPHSFLEHISTNYIIITKFGTL